MKAGSLWPGTDYAYQENRGRGRDLPLDAQQVKVLQLEKVPIQGGKRDRTLVLVSFLDGEDAAITEGYYATPRQVQARDIIDFWEEYKEQREPLLREREERQRQFEIDEERRRQERIEREAITAVAWFIRQASLAMERHKRAEEEREKQERLKKRLIRVKNVMITKGFKGDQIGIDRTNVYIPTVEMERWLGIDSESS